MLNQFLNINRDYLTSNSIKDVIIAIYDTRIDSNAENNIIY